MAAWRQWRMRILCLIAAFATFGCEQQLRAELAQCRLEVAQLQGRLPEGTIEVGAAAPENAADEAVTEAAPKPSISQWQSREDVDPLTQRPVNRLYTRSMETFELDFPYRGEQRATLTIRQHPQHGQDVILSIERGQIICRSRGCRLNVVFDDDDPERWNAVDSADGSRETVFLRRTERFVRKLEAANEVRIAVTIHQGGTQTFTFAGRSREHDGAED